MNFIESKIEQNLQGLKNSIVVSSERITDVSFVKSDYKKDNTPPTDGWQPFGSDTFFTKHDEHYWFHANFHTPKVDTQKTVSFRLSLAFDDWDACRNPQGLIYVNGHMEQGMDMNHKVVQLDSDSDIDLYCYFYTGLKKLDFRFIPELIIEDSEIKKLYYDISVPFEAAKLYQENEQKTEILKQLEIAVNYTDFRMVHSEDFYNGIRKAQAYMTEEFYNKFCEKSNISVNCIGHTHIDIAWEWTYAQTMEKAQRSFSTVIKLMKQYPEYKFMSSQPILYDIVKKEAPELFGEIRQMVAQGRWEPEGGMWLECDCNLTSGESLVRQILYGKKFMKDEFGKESQILWLPDTFGYSAALPQILNKCGITGFVTSKISWNDTNTMPHDTFMWQGIDGSEIFTNFITCQHFSGYDFSNRFATYNADLKPAQMLGTWARYHDKKFNTATLMPFGYGDGGGGPTAEMLENYRRIKKGIPGLPVAVMKTAGEHIAEVQANFTENGRRLGYVPRWVGELYLELHRGTYTSMGRNKRNNRKSEFAIAQSEFLSVLAMKTERQDYPDKALREAWRLIQLNQFHDILPGSSIKEVYEDSDRDYARIFGLCDTVEETAMTTLSNAVSTAGGYFVVNATGFCTDGTIKADGKTVETEMIPAYGWKVLSEIDSACAVKISGLSMENKYYKAELNENGEIISLYDKRYDREIVTDGETLNALCVFEDIPRNWDNWEINEYYKCKKWRLDSVKSIKPVFDGSRAGFAIEREYQNSTVEQTIWMYSKLDRIDFETKIDWHEHHQLLKAFFPIRVHTAKATYDIQFGNVERPTHQNTGWDEAKFEVCAHKWADVSDADYGVTLLNDCKYGHSCEGSKMALTLLRCGTYPNPDADQGRHEMVYSLVPHSGSFREAEIYRKAYTLNQPLCAKKISANKGTLPEQFSLISCDSQNIVIDTVKKAETDNGVIVRLFEAHNITKKVQLSVGIPFEKAFLCDMLENELAALAVDGTEISLNVKNFEIVTVKLV